MTAFPGRRSPRFVRALLLIALGLMLGGIAFAQAPLIGRTPPQPGARNTADTARTIVIDASGSMWKNVDGQNNRAELAAQFVGTLTARLATEEPQHKLGLVRLGYQYSWLDRSIPRDTLCRDVELVVPPQATAAQAQGRVAAESGFGRKVDDDDYNPKGQTPLALAIEQAADASPPGGTLVVVTDLEKDDVCLPDPCGPDGRPIPRLQRLLQEKNIRIRYVIAAGLIGAIGERARHFAACFGAEYRVLENLDQARTLGDEVGGHLMAEATPRPVPRGLITVAVQDAQGRELGVPSGGQLDVHENNTTTPILHAPGQVSADLGRYESSLQVGSTRLQVHDAEVSAGGRTEIAFVLAPATLRIRLVDSDALAITDEPNAVWEIAANPSQPQNHTIRVKGTFLNQALPAGSYRVRVYTATHEFNKDVTLAAGEELDASINIGTR
jgi:hypothetical protein